MAGGRDIAGPVVPCPAVLSAPALLLLGALASLAACAAAIVAVVAQRLASRRRREP
jgi:hypothetical protein